jgi:hypothetical protein
MLMDDGLIVTGIRHYSPEMRNVLKRIYGEGYHLRVSEEGFVDQAGTFIGRKTAWIIAERSGQIIRQCSEPGTLYSENLY